jgi:molybdopterin molybdotransferase
VISVEAAREIVARSIQPITGVERPALRDAHGRVLAEDVSAKGFFPAADSSMMDGFAFAAEDLSERFRIVGEVPAGSLPTVEVRAGECVRIYTGAPLPVGANAVIPQEDTRVEGDAMLPTQRSSKRWVRLRGSEGKPGQVIARSTTRLGGVDLAALAQAGCIHPPVVPQLRVAHIATGDEVVDAMSEPGPGKIRDTNSLFLQGALAEFGVEHSSWHCGDVLGDLIAALPSADSPVRLLLISGGASVGAYDFGARALRDAGFTIHFDKVNLRPGKPLTFTTRGAQAAFVIPGNPVSHFVCFETVIRLAVERFLGLAPRWDFIRAALGGQEPLPIDRRETFWPARVVIRDGSLVALPKAWSSSGDTFSLVGTNALIRVPQEGEPIPPGGEVRVLLLDVPAGE